MGRTASPGTRRCSLPTPASCSSTRSSPATASRILDQIKIGDDKPVTTIINTHTHGDHTGATSFRARSNSSPTRTPRRTWRRWTRSRATNAAFLPGRRSRTRCRCFSGKDRIDLYYFGPGHTQRRRRHRLSGAANRRDGRFVRPEVGAAGGFRRMAGTRPRFRIRSRRRSARSRTWTPSSLATARRRLDRVVTLSVRTIESRDEVGRPSGIADFMRDFVAAAQAAKKAGKSAADAAKALNLPAKYKTKTWPGAML